ncbi:LacI family DNA-binding transcriptional regulator [Sinomonas sp. G460-2]|uniref:LacI family DNA-binding transcriptional regulator n=1 Tax=Sinomonas sp. G460-2 TaxID=3393464 RepID=UPI0039EEA0D7
MKPSVPGGDAPAAPPREPLGHSMKAPRIQDVAAEAGVSVATVSRAMNGAGSVSPELKKRVQAAARKLGYRPNTVARSLRRRHTKIWALIISDITNPFFTSVARGVEDVAQKAGYSVMLCNADENPTKEANYLQVAGQDQVAGVILSPHSAQTDISALRDGSIPCIVIDRTLTEAVDSVLVDSRSSAREATLHLLAEGWASPACITGPEDASTAVERRKGYEDALRERGLSAQEKTLHQPFKTEGGRAAAAAMLDSDAPPDSFFIANATLALGVLAELAERGLRLGTDIGVVTFDEAPWAPLLNPPVSVVAQPAYDIGAEAARLLMSRIEGHGPPFGRKTTLATTLIVRASSQRQLPDPFSEKAS